MENETLRDFVGLGVLIAVISAAQLWGGLLLGGVRVSTPLSAAVARAQTHA